MTFSKQLLGLLLEGGQEAEMLVLAKRSVVSTKQQGLKKLSVALVPAILLRIS